MSVASSTDTLIAAAILPPVVVTCDCPSSLMASGIQHQLLLVRCDGQMEWLLDKFNGVS